MPDSYKVLLIVLFLCFSCLRVAFATEDVEVRSHQIFVILDGSKEAAIRDSKRMDASATRMILSVAGEYNAASVLIAGKNTKVILKPRYNLKPATLHLMYQKLKKEARNSKIANFNKAITTAMNLAGDSNRKNGIRTSIITIIAGKNPPSPDEYMVDDLIESGTRLYVIRLVSGELSENWEDWREAAISTNGIFITNDQTDLLPKTLFDIYLEAINPQLLEVTGNAFQVDRVTTKVTVVTKIQKDIELTLVSPDNWRVWIKTIKFPVFGTKT